MFPTALGRLSFEPLRLSLSISERIGSKAFIERHAIYLKERFMSSTPSVEPKKSRGTSLVFLLVVAVLGVIGYFAGPTIMTYVFLMQEKFSPAPAINSVSNEDSRFAQLDKDTNGKIDAEEGGRGLKSAFEKFDADKDGALSKPEFVEYLKEKAKSGGGGMAAPRGEDEVEPAKEKKEETPPAATTESPKP